MRKETGRIFVQVLKGKLPVELTISSSDVSEDAAVAMPVEKCTKQCKRRVSSDSACHPTAHPHSQETTCLTWKDCASYI